MTACRLEPCVQLPLSKETLREIVDKGKDWTLMHGNGILLLIIKLHLVMKQVVDFLLSYNRYLSCDILLFRDVHAIQEEL